MTKCAQNIDVVLINPDIGVSGRHGFKTFIPERHRMENAIGFGCGSQVSGRPRLRQLKCILEYPVYPFAGKHAFLKGRFGIGAFIYPTADFGIFPFIVFADNHQVDLSDLPFYRGLDTGKKAHRPQGYVLVKFPSNRYQQTPQGKMVRHTGKPDSAQKDRVIGGQSCDAVRGHHPPVFPVIGAAPVKKIPIHLKTEPAAGRIHDTNPFVDDFLSDSVTRNNGDMMSFHWQLQENSMDIE
jgi:hypothetical protein